MHPVFHRKRIDRSTFLTVIWLGVISLSCDAKVDFNSVIRPQISKGSASQGLRALRQLGAVSSTFSAGDRKERFHAEIRLRKLVGGFLREQADPHLDKGVARLKQLKELLDRLEDQDSLKRGMRRHDILSVWHRQMSRLLPWVKMIVGKSDRLPSQNKD